MAAGSLRPSSASPQSRLKRRNTRKRAQKPRKASTSGAMPAALLRESCCAACNTVAMWVTALSWRDQAISAR